MDSFLAVLLVLFGSAALGLSYVQSVGRQQISDDVKSIPAFLKFRNSYLIVYALMMIGDWLQGPYVYALYEHYGFSVQDIGRLFVAGFGSSMLFGTFVGSLADKYGRRFACLLYVVTYALSCVTKHSPSYSVLMLGRLLGGIATSLLFSAFESWLVAEHTKRGFSDVQLGDIFSKAVLLGNGLMAIVAGLLGNFLVENMQLGPVAPFDAAILALAVGGLLIHLNWSENYGDSHSQSLVAQFSKAAHCITSDRRIALLGAMQSLFEASMYTFVFLWTPALSSHGEKIPHGTIFSCFMTASMVGSSAAGVLMARGRPESYMRWVFLLSAACLAVPAYYHAGQGWKTTEMVSDASMSSAGKVQMVAFCIFEMCVGVFWPSMMTMRAAYVPEEMRATIINCFRIPLNLFVCLVLYKVSEFPLSGMFGLCTLFLLACAACQLTLSSITRKDTAPEPPREASV